MKALSLYREWIWAIRYLGAPVLNRTIPLPLEARANWVAIHATKGNSGAASHKHMRWLRAMAEEAGIASRWIEAAYGPLLFPDLSLVLDIESEPRKALVGAVRFVNCHRQSGPWTAPGQYHWVIGEARWLETPLDMWGQQGLWVLPEDLATALCTQLGLENE